MMKRSVDNQNLSFMNFYSIFMHFYLIRPVRIKMYCDSENNHVKQKQKIEYEKWVEISEL